MGYRIEYGMVKTSIGKDKLSFSRIAVMTAGFLALFVLMTGVFWTSGRQKLQDYLLPGDPAVTGQALETMVSQLKAGVPVADAVEAFCQEVLDGAEIPD